MEDLVSLATVTLSAVLPGEKDITKAKPLYCSSSDIQVHHGRGASGKDRPEALKPVCLFSMSHR